MGQGGVRVHDASPLALGRSERSRTRLSVEFPHQRIHVRIYLADLGHNLLTLSSDVYPLGIANLATFAGSRRPDLDLEFRLFREPQDLRRAIDECPPDALGLSNYAWNEELSLSFARYAKKRNPATLTLLGGPNWPLVSSVQEEYLRTRKHVDAFVEGPTYEGEQAFLNLIERFVDVGQSVEGIYDGPVEGVAWIHPQTNEFQKAPELERIRDLDSIPSPYLSGLMDPFFDTGYFPLLQIARGCPFTCAFCNSGVRGNNKAYAHSVENVIADLDYIAKRVKPEVTLCFADDNFGMYERDVEIADHIGRLQRDHDWPRYIRTTTGKNRGERIIRVMRKVNGALPMTSAVQSLNPEVLKNIKRDNIKLETYQELQEELRSLGMQSYGELILCLPGETKASFMDSVEKLLDSGSKRISAHQLMLLHGAELSNPDSRERFGFKTRHRVVARNIGDYTDEPIIEVEEMVVETPEFSYADYLDTRVFHLLVTIFHYEGNFEEAFELAKAYGMSGFELSRALHASIDQAPEELRKVIDEFLVESEDELFETREACLTWAHKNYKGLVDGTIGGNLLSKYSMIGRFYATGGALEFLGSVIASELGERGLDPTELRDVMGYLRNALLHAPFRTVMDREVEWVAEFDVEAWVADGYEQPLATHRLDSAVKYSAVVDEDRRSLIEEKIETFGEHPAGLGKFTRTMFARDLRRRVVRCGPADSPA